MRTNNYNICDFCVGRELNSSKLPDEGKIENSLTINTQKACDLCFGIVGIVKKRIKKLKKELGNFPYETFKVEVQLDKDFRFADSYFTQRNINAIPLKRVVITKVESYIEKIIGLSFEKLHPELLVIFKFSSNPVSISIGIKINPIFIYGKYRKFKRGLPQTKWPCSYCKGKKCKKCDFSGLQYKSSVESIISEHFKEIFKPKSIKFHGAGREDIDVLMLGSGRPFVIELKSPKVRYFNLDHIEHLVNKSKIVNVKLLLFTTKMMVRLLKASSSKSFKIYRADILKNKDTLNSFKNNILPNLSFPFVIYQNTPNRVLHRRANLLRKKSILGIKIMAETSSRIELEIKAEGGTYIKEFISGDNGRTIPSISSLMEVDCFCEQLDVIYIDDRFLEKFITDKKKNPHSSS